MKCEVTKLFSLFLVSSPYISEKVVVFPPPWLSYNCVVIPWYPTLKRTTSEEPLIENLGITVSAVPMASKTV